MLDGSPPSRAATPTTLVYRAARAVLDAAPDARFVLRRAEVDADTVEGKAGLALRHVLRSLRESDHEDPRWAESLAGALARAGGALERAEQPAGARLLFELASELRPGCAATALHVARAARRAGDTEAARAHYERAAALDRDGRIARLARIGEAMLSRRAERRISEEIRRAVRSGDGEAAGVGLEARASLRCESARCRDAIRDLCACALRYPDREDQARAAQRVAALLIATHDLDAAREALLLAHRIGTAEQRAESRARLYALSEELGDALGMKRWSGGSVREPAGTSRAGSAGGPSGPSRARTTGGPAEATRARASGEPPRVSGDRGSAVPSPDTASRRRALPVIRDWREAVERRAGAS